MKKLKPILGVLVLITTIAAFTYYVVKHPTVVDKLREISLPMLLGLLFFNFVAFTGFVLVVRAILHVYDKKISFHENFLLNAYSTLVNFFGPGQSGPAFRGLYLRQKHGLHIKQYIFASLTYYGFYVILSALLLCIGTRPWWQTCLLMLVAALASVFTIRRYRRQAKIKQTTGFNIINLGLMFLATCMQMIAQVALFFIELRAVSPGVSFSQIISYTGAANFSLFISITPNGIGIREGLLALSQNLHHINLNSIVSANIIDRAVYLVFLGLLFVLVVVFHAKSKLQVARIKKDNQTT